MKKQTILLLLIGSLCLSITLLTRHFFTIPEDPADFIKGFGAALIIGALFVQRKLSKAKGAS